MAAGLEDVFAARCLCEFPTASSSRLAWTRFSACIALDGRRLRTDRYRITRYTGDEQPAVELFDHQTDPPETVNVAASHPEVVEELLAQRKANQPSF